MPLYEYLPVKVMLTVEADGHKLTFEETDKATGTRWHGGDPRETGYASSDTLENNVRRTVDACVDRTIQRSAMLTRRAYPTCHDEEAAGG